MDAVAFPPPPAPFLDDDFDFGDFTFASAPAPAAAPVADPQPAAFAAFDDDWGDFVATPVGSNPSAPPTPPTATSTASWEKPRGPLPLSLFGADDQEDEDKDGRGEEGPAAPPPTATAHQRAPSFASCGSRPADLKDLLAGLYGSQPLSAASDADAGVLEEAEDDDGFEGDGWEFKAATTEPAGLVGGGAYGDATGKIEDISNSLGSDQEDWSSFASANGELSHVHVTDFPGNPESTGESMNSSSYFAANNLSILDLCKVSNMGEASCITQNAANSAQSSSDLFSNSEMNSSFETDENHSVRSTSDSILIEFYHRLREESLAVISKHVKDLEKVERSPVPPDENSKAVAIEREIQEIYGKLEESSLPNGFCTDEHLPRDVSVTELLNSTKEEYLKDFDREYHLAEKIAQVIEDVSVAVELYKQSVSTLEKLELGSKEEQHNYVHAWHSMLLYCAQEMQHGGALWQESCRSRVCDQVISQGGHWFIALGEIYRVAQILYCSLQYFKPWILADPGMLSKMLACFDSCKNCWTSGLQTALKLVAESTRLDASAAKSLMVTIKKSDELDASNLQNLFPNNEMACRLTLLPASVVQGMKVVTWNGDHYFVKVVNLWVNRMSSDPPQLSQTPSPLMKNAAAFTGHVE